MFGGTTEHLCSSIVGDGARHTSNGASGLESEDISKLSDENGAGCKSVVSPGERQTEVLCLGNEAHVARAQKRQPHSHTIMLDRKLTNALAATSSSR